MKNPIIERRYEVIEAGYGDQVMITGRTLAEELAQREVVSEPAFEWDTEVPGQFFVTIETPDKIVVLKAEYARPPGERRRTNEI